MTRFNRTPRDNDNEKPNYRSVQTHFFKSLTWFMTGIVLAFSMAAVLISGTFSLQPLSKVRDVYEIRDNVYQAAVELENGHQETSGRVVLDKGEFFYNIGIQDYTNQLNYFCVWLKDISTETVHWEVVYENQRENKVSEVYSCELTEGLNLIPVEKNNFNVISIDITGENGTSFYVESMQLRENEPVFTWGKGILIFSVVFAIYCLISALIYKAAKRMKIRWNPYCWIDILQEIYILVAEQLRKIVSFIPQSGSVRNYCRTGLFLLIFLYTVYVDSSGTYYSKSKYNLVIYLLLLIFIAVLSVESKLEKRNWNNPLVWSWLVLWMMACISDFFVPKGYRYTGYVMILAGGFLIFVWNNMKKPSEFIADFVRAVHIFFWMMTVYCLICRPETSELRYSGFSNNPSVFALYLGTCWAVVLGELESRVRKREQLRKMIPFVIEGCAVASFSWKSQSACPLLCMAGITFIWLFKMVRRTRKKPIRKNLAAVIISAAILILPVYGGLTWGLMNIPGTFGTEITYEIETRIPRTQLGLVANAAGEGSRLVQKFSSSSLSQILSGRDYYWRTYLRDMNILGHEDMPRMWGHRRLPHNAVIGIAHRYGVFAAVPYVIMLIAAIVRTSGHGRKKARYAAVPFYVCLSSIAMSMADNLEQPFVWLPWIALYVMMGCAFRKKKKNRSSLRPAKARESS